MVLMQHTFYHLHVLPVYLRQITRWFIPGNMVSKSNRRPITSIFHNSWNNTLPIITISKLQRFTLWFCNTLIATVRICLSWNVKIYLPINPNPFYLNAKAKLFISEKYYVLKWPLIIQFHSTSCQTQIYQLGCGTNTNFMNTKH